MTKDGTRRALRCPNGCGAVLDFTEIRACADCHKVVCGNCRREFRRKVYCKPCGKKRADEASRHGEAKDMKEVI